MTAALTDETSTSAIPTSAIPTSAIPTPPLAPKPRITVRPAPRREPLFDDELQTRHLSLVGPYDRQLPFGDAEATTTSPRRTGQPDDFAAQHTRRANLPNPELFARRLVVGLIEVATGRRSPLQLATQTSLQVHSGLMRDRGPLMRLGSPGRPGRIHTIHVSEPADGVAEIAVVLAVGARFRAMALRLEGLDGRWRCTRLQVG